MKHRRDRSKCKRDSTVSKTFSSLAKQSGFKHVEKTKRIHGKGATKSKVQKENTE